MLGADRERQLTAMRCKRTGPISIHSGKDMNSNYGSRRARVLITAGITLAICACRSKPQEYTGPYGKQVGDAVPKIEQAVGLKFKRPPKVETRSKEQVRAFL